MKSVKYLLQIKEKFGIKTDMALADKIGCSRTAISLYMSGDRIMDDKTCLKIAKLLEIHPWEILVDAGIDRDKKTGQRSLWADFLEYPMMTKAASVLLGVFLSVNLFLTPDTANAASIEGKSTVVENAKIDPLQLMRNLVGLVS